MKDRFAQLRATLLPEEQKLLKLRIDERRTWTEIVMQLSGDTPSVELRRETALLRKRFERLVRKVRRRAKAMGLMGVKNSDR